MNNSPQKIPSLYHYTSQNGLLGIIESRSLWFTDIFYLNDATEFKYIFELVQNELEIESQNYMKYSMESSPLLIIRFLQRFSTHIDVTEVASFCVFSLSEVPDLLSQWRGYCSDESGYCIEFGPYKLNRFLENKNIILNKCIYDEEEQRKHINKIIKNAINDCSKEKNIEKIKKYMKYELAAIKSIYEPLSKNEFSEITNIYKPYLKEIYTYAPIFKHKTFSEEKEWRMYALFETGKGARTKFRAGKSMPIPYNIVEIAKSNEEMPIKNIIVGPTIHPELSKKSVEDFLLTKKMDFCKVGLSKIPYRD